MCYRLEYVMRRKETDQSRKEAQLLRDIIASLLETKPKARE